MQRLTLLLFSSSVDFPLTRALSGAWTGSNRGCSVRSPAKRPYERTSPGSRGSGRVREFLLRQSSRLCCLVTFAMMAPLGSLVEGVPHGYCHSSDQSGGPLAFGAGGAPQTQRGGAH